jgi:hypothetical protein
MRQLTAADSHRLDAYFSLPKDKARGGLVVIQEASSYYPPRHRQLARQPAALPGDPSLWRARRPDPDRRHPAHFPP